MNQLLTLAPTLSPDDAGKKGVNNGYSEIKA